MKKSLLLNVAIIALMTGCSQQTASVEPVAAEPLAVVAQPDAVAHAMAAPTGVNTQPLTDIGSINARLAKLEILVGALSQEIRAAMPAVQKLNAVQAEINDLTKALNAIDSSTGTESVSVVTPTPNASPVIVEKVSAPIVAHPSDKVGMAPIIDPAPVKKVAAVVKEKPVAPKAEVVQQTGPVKVSALRIGEHKSMTRVVLDVSGKADFKTDLDNQEKILIVNLPKASWAAATSQSFAKSPIISAMSVEEDDQGGKRLVLQLKKSVKIMDASTMKASSGKGARIVIDLKGEEA